MFLRAYIILLSSFGVIFGITVDCDETFIADNGHKCYPCSPGNYKVSDCVVDGEQPRCSPCPEGRFMPDCDTGEQCGYCKQFCPDTRQVIVKNCTTTNDLECQCQTGFFWRHGVCIRHKDCKAGKGLAAKGTPYADTTCISCSEGLTYSNSSSLDMCIPCSTCDDASVKINCTVTTDAVCGHERRHKPHNKDTTKSGLNAGTIVGIIVASLIVAGLVLTCFFVSRCRVNIPDENSEEAESEAGENFTGTESREGTDILPLVSTNIFTEDEISRPFHGGSQMADDADCFDNQAFEGDKGDKFETEIWKSEADTIEDLPNVKGARVCERRHSDKTIPNQDNTENDSGNETAHACESLCSEDSDISSIHSEATLENNKDLTNYETRSQMEDSVVTADVGPVSARPMSSDIENQNQPEETVSEDEQQREYHNEQPIELNPAVHPDHSSILCKDAANEASIGVKDSASETSNLVTSGTDPERKRQNYYCRREDERAWFEIMDYLPHHMVFDEFKKFVRRLANRTNAGFYQTIDAKLANSREETTSVYETMYQVLQSWRQATPHSKPEDVLKTLRRCNLNNLCNNLIQKLKDENIWNKDIDEHNIQTTPNENVVPSFVKNDNDIHIDEPVVAEQEPEMNELKPNVHEVSLKDAVSSIDEHGKGNEQQMDYLKPYVNEVSSKDAATNMAGADGGNVEELENNCLNDEDTITNIEETGEGDEHKMKELKHCLNKVHFRDADMNTTEAEVEDRQKMEELKPDVNDESTYGAVTNIQNSDEDEGLKLEEPKTYVHEDSSKIEDFDNVERDENDEVHELNELKPYVDDAPTKDTVTNIEEPDIVNEAKKRKELESTFEDTGSRNEESVKDGFRN